MAKQILYGVGKSILRDFVDPTKIIALSYLQDVSVSFGGSEDDVTGGDSPYPIATFSKEKSITISATSATFSLPLFNVTQGIAITTGASVMSEILEAVIPVSGSVSLDFVPIAGKTVISGFVEILTNIPAVGEFYVDIATKQIHFDVVDAGKEIIGVYDRATAVTSQTMSALRTTMSKPFVYIHRLPIYDDNSQIVAQSQLTVFKARATGNFELGLKPQTAYAPKIELKALDPRRADGKLWDFIIE